MAEDMHTALSNQLDAHAETFDGIFTALDSDTNHEGQEAHEALHEAPLEVTQHSRIAVLLTCGGPHVEVTADLDSTGGISNATLTGHWGHERIERSVTSGTSLYRALAAYAEAVVL